MVFIPTNASAKPLPSAPTAPSKPTTPSKPAAPVVAEVPAIDAKKGKKGKGKKGAAIKPSRLQQLNGRRVRLVSSAVAMRDELAALLSKEPTLLPPAPGAAQGKPNPAHVLLTRLAKTLDEVSGALTKTDTDVNSLQAIKWEPIKIVRGWKAGDEAVLKPRVEEKYTRHGAYKAEELRPVVIVSVHGQDVRIRTKKGEGLGLLPAYYLKRPEAPEAAE